MNLEHSFDIMAEPDVAFAYLMDVNRVATCVPGVSLQEALDENTYRGTLKVKVGPVTVKYGGIARILSADPVTRVATIEAEGEESGTAGSVRANATMSVVPAAGGSRVTVSTDLALTGRVATMGKGVIEQVGNRMVAQTSQRIEQAILESVATAEPVAVAPPVADPPGPLTAESTSATRQAPSRPAPAHAAPARPAPAEDDSALRVMPLLGSLIADWIRRTFGKIFGTRRDRTTRNTHGEQR
ncbi:SRPBCC family protein [Streptosporangium sp. NPDC006930]|uniref:CoxG family protein n=1 Tax=Streptosporangium sp. NPDC006930 TaxID=3154783 RepID=UPI00342E03EA